jgi:selenocysteine lyase/cysteine desulfurase
MASQLFDAQRLFPHARGYLDTASVGMPPTSVAEALRAEVVRWERGEAAPPDYDADVEGARAAFGRLVGAPADAVAIAGQLSYFSGVLAASLPAGARVLAAQGEFTSVTFPFLAREGVEVIVAPLEALADRLDEGGIDLVAVSAVQSADGRLADLDAIVAAAERHGCATYVDATQAAGWLPLDATRVDYLAASAYKWLLSPRGTAFLAVRPERVADLPPLAAGWYAGEDRWTSIYDPPLRLAPGARRLDLSPAWLCWGPTRVALELIERVGVAAIHAHDVGLADRLRQRLGMAAAGSAIVAVEVPDAAGPLPAGLRASMRAGRLRACFHLYNTEDDVEELARYLGA